MKNERTLTLVALLCGAGAPLACSGGAVNIGNTNAIGSELSDYAAVWDGYAEAFSFWPDGSDRVRVTIDGSGQGTVEIGDAALLAPPTDPNLGFPPDSAPFKQPVVSGKGTQTALFEGFLYPLHAAAVNTDRIQLGLDPNDVYTTWCPLQTSYPAQPGTDFPYACLPLNGATYIPDQGCFVTQADGTTQSVDCTKLNLCLNMACSCTATACTASTVADGTPVGQYPVELDGALDSSGTTLTGTLRLGPGAGGVTVVLKKK